ncbi:MAG TPA: nuclear transport factor 2 family protein [Longimicrobiales bacterium]|nr:nuclear transport factor 2 family protein [Longimicrobiales bacterium]
MMQELLDLEQKFWKGDSGFYEQNLADDALMVFADPVGVLNREAIVESIGASSRWRQVEMTEIQQLEIGADAVLLTYLASAVRDGSEPAYQARASSLYVMREGAWMLAFHQQTPVA